jgi:hypothetical protein
MLKEHEPPKEPLRIKAERKWKNNEVIKHIKEAQQKPKLVDPNKPPEVAETIINTGRRDGPLRRFERQFIRDLREVVEAPRRQIIEKYRVAIERRRYLLLKEKLRRLQLAQQSRGGSK